MPARIRWCSMMSVREGQEHRVRLCAATKFGSEFGVLNTGVRLLEFHRWPVSCVWRFNALYWQALADWEKVTGRAYEQALPGGESDARNAGVTTTGDCST
jgi:hypothetical protein